MKIEFMKSKVEPVIGWLLLAVLLYASTRMKVGVRLLLGLGFGYVLMRAYTGFAGSVNRAFRTGSTKLMRSMALMFFVSAVLFVGVMYLAPQENFKLSVKAINLGLALGGMMFGFGMALSSCCASGALTDLSNGTPRAVATLVFFFAGVYLGFPIQHSQDWIKNTMFSSASYEGKGVYLPDLFGGNNFHGYMGAVILTGVFSLILFGYAFWYEKMRKNRGQYTGLEMETFQHTPVEIDTKNGKLFSKETYYYLFAKPWTLNQGGIGLAVMVIVLLGITGRSWSVTSTFGIWFGKFLMLFGLSAEQVADFAMMKPDRYATPFLLDGGSVQNVAILIGAIVYLLMAGRFIFEFKDGLSFHKRDLLLYALGGFTMGLGTRIADGCNAGALFAPISNLSLSGWVYLVFLFMGGFIGNRFFVKCKVK